MLAALAVAGPAYSQSAVTQFDVQPQPLGSALLALGRQANISVAVPQDLVAGKTAPAVAGELPTSVALNQLLSGTGLQAEFFSPDVVRIVQQGEGGSPQGGSAAGGGATVEALVVTAQKREEDIQDVPIAISAFSQKQLEAQKIEGGFDLLKAIPNVTFSKNNFTSYNFSIRGVGTKAISATTDPGVAVSFNNTALIVNRLFEQEYYDLERVEVLRGPQGTLYGRNATSGVINVISAKPDLNDFEGSLKAEVGGYDTRRLVGMINIPIIEDKLAIRLAGAGTQRDGYDYNSVTQNRINGRELWSTRLTVGFEPTSNIRGNLIWEHFEEDDNRSRTGKQLCHRDPGPDVVGDTNIYDTTTGTPGTDEFEENLLIRQATYSLGCQPGNLYDDEAFGTPNGISLNYVLPFLALRREGIVFVSAALGTQPGTSSVLCCGESLLRFGDPYGGLYQSRDLREIASIKDPVYRAKADIYELNLDFDITPSLTFSSQTAYVEDETYSFQDFNRFNTLPVFNDTSILEPAFGFFGPASANDFRQFAPRPEGTPLGTPGVFCDPQLGCSDTIVAFDIAQGVATQFNQELRLQSDFDGPVNFSVGANYTKFETEIDYYVFINILTALAESMPLYDPGGLFGGGPPVRGQCAYSEYFLYILNGPVPTTTTDPYSACSYVDPNPIESIDGNGHNYFRSRNPYDLESWAAFGEVYWNIRDDLKLTAGLRYTEDTKTFIPVPSQLLLAPSFQAGGTTAFGYPEDPPIVQNWGEWTGRLGIDWKPDLSFTDESLLYAFYSRGYKGGGANPPRPGFATAETAKEVMLDQGYSEAQIDAAIADGVLPVLKLSGDEYGETFEPEFVNAFELGAKNTLLGGGLTFNATAFYYDYIDYQVSQIRDRTAVNENFDAATWGLEFEALFAPNRDFQLIANFGYLDTKIADGEESIDLMNRTNSNPDFIVVKPWVQLPSNCVLPVGVVENFVSDGGDVGYYRLCGLAGAVANSPLPIDPATGEEFNRDLYDGTNGFEDLHGGAGIFADLSGNELPNAPHFTTNIGAQYGRDILDGSWRVTLRGDAYWQSQSWARVYNSDPYDKLHGWYNLNVSVNVANEELGLEAEFYVKNLLDKSPITDAFLNSDDTGLTTNVFVLDPRLVGFYVRKTF